MFAHFGSLLRRCVAPVLSMFCVPNQPKTPTHSVRVPDDLWQAARDKARERGETLTEVIVRALIRYLRD